MGSASFLGLWQTFVLVILLLDFSRVTSDMRLRAGHIKIPKISWSSTQFIGNEVAGSFLYDADEGRKLAVSSSEGSSRREVQALMAFKDSVTTDPLQALINWSANDSDACDWRGVKCAPLFKNVVALNLRNLGLVGGVPKLIGYLNYLEYIDISNNFLSGSIPDSIANCSRLSYLSISDNQVSGEIPSSIGNLFQLQTLLAAGNNLSGLIPESIGNCSLLGSLELTSNFLEGSIPMTLSKLSNLERLSLGLNSLSGTIPNTLCNCSSLATLNISHNLRLGGELPEELRLLTKMEVFLLYECNFVGFFPSWITNFTSLIDFEVHANRFSGEIPKDIGQLSEKMTTFSLFKNQVSGPIPKEIVNCTALVRLPLGENQITGDIPSDIGLLRNLEILTVHLSEISGVIPSSISNCTALRYLVAGYSPLNRQPVPSWVASLARLEIVWLPGANLYGEIPPSFGQLSNLQKLVMTSNNLGGVLPDSLGNLSRLILLELNANQFHGEIPLKITGNLSSLTALFLSGNYFVGSIPEFSNLYNLVYLEIGANLLTGNFDSNVGLGNPHLEGILLFDNDFKGPLPDGIGNFSNLQVIELEYNSFSGSIPASWGNLTNLGNLYLHSNSLEGVIPLTLIRCIKLLGLSFSVNRFQGPIPHEFGQLMNLEALYLDSNFLTGIFPFSFANLTNMREMHLSHNRFSAVISGYTLSMMKFSLSYLDISHNFISGSWPPEFSLLSNLQYLDVSFNNISGSVLPGLGKCFGLTYLDISVNNFSGTLPEDIGFLQQLRFFNAATNNFDGPIPTLGLFSTQNITWYSFLGNPKLCGSARLVSLPCSQPEPSSNDCRAFKCRRTWIPVAISMSVVLLLGIIFICRWILAGHKRKGPEMMMDIVFPGRIVLSEEELMTTIQGGNDSIIGMGAKSIVYRGEKASGEIFALKVLQNEGTLNQDIDKCAMEVLLKEVHTLAQLRHVNIIKILGLCITKHVKALILEHMPRGSLQDLLYDSGRLYELSYQNRLKIILGITEALVYLHHSFHKPIIHRDLKPSNILLGMDMNPKLADFGISRFATYQDLEGNNEASASTVCGTFGYLAPEYATNARISTKGDVYSYGVILLELLTRRKPADGGTLMDNRGLVEFVIDSFEERACEILDPSLAEEWRMNSTIKDQLMLLFRVGLLCTRATPSARPDMSVVLEMLRQIRDIGSETVPVRTIEELANETLTFQPKSLDQADSLSS